MTTAQEKTKILSLIALTKVDGWEVLKQYVDDRVSRLLSQGKHQPDAGMQIQRAADMAYINGMLDVINEVESAVAALKRLESGNDQSRTLNF